MSVSVQPATLAFAARNARETPLTQALAVTVSGADASTLHFSVTAQGQAVAQVSDFVRTSSTGGYYTVTPQSASTLGIGTYYSLLTVLACQDATCSSGPIANTPFDVNVTYSVAGVIVSPSSLAFTVDDQTPASASAGQLQISGAPQQRWTASADVPWLSLSVTSGEMGSQLTATLVPEQTDALQNDVHSGKITLAPDQGDPVTVSVALTVSRAQVDEVAPHVAIAGHTDEVILRGLGFGNVPLTGVRFGTVSATAFRLVSATEVRATPPVLPAGTYPVRLEGVARTFASLIVIEAPAFQAEALSYPTAGKPVSALIYDAQRQAILVGLQSSSGSQVVRFAHGASGWGSPTAVEAGRYPALALSTNGDFLLSTKGTSILELDPVTLATRATISTGETWDSGEGTWDHLTGFGVSNDGQVLATSTSAPNGTYFTPLYRELVSDRTVQVLDNLFHWGQVRASANGAWVFMGSTGSTSQLSEVQRYDASTGQLSGLGVTLDLTGLSVDRTGATLLATLHEERVNQAGTTKLVVTRAVFDGDLAYLGALPSTTAAAVISPDGARAYTYDQSSKLLRTFDLTQDPVDTLDPVDNQDPANLIFPELGSGTTLIAAPDNKPTAVAMAITPDGGTVILAGSLRVVVQPVP